MFSPARQRGLALFDVLIALLLLGVGVSAMSQLQGLVLLEGGHSRARATAAQLAREKTDDLRQFSQLQAGDAGTYAYDDIGDDRGGRRNADGSLIIAAGEVALSDVLYQRHWSAAAYSWCEPGAAMTPGLCAGARRAAIQQIRVSLSWVDADGSPSTLTMETAIAAIDPVLAGDALIRRPTLLPPLAVPQ